MPKRIDLEKCVTISGYAKKHSTPKKKMHTAQVYRLIHKGELSTTVIGGVTFIIEQ